ncbi:MAG: lipoprotein insertase outer membrane protein LolB [Gammaproteobacteria bacterium]|nr:lipoprotein insertase outer membrane protein LolB [Gammaproteobacteria bacterium]
MRPLALLVLGALAVGCAPLPVDTEPAPDNAAEALWQARQQQLADVDAWALTGRLAIQNSETGFNAGLNWRQAGEDYRLRLMAPFGRGTWAISRASGYVELATPEHGSFRAATVGELMERHLGWQLPVDGARYWMLGVPEPDAEVEAYRIDSDGRLTDLVQRGWRISVNRYQSVADPAAADAPVDLPARLFLTYGDLEVRIAVTRWEFD